jgi:hypothetical protein
MKREEEIIEAGIDYTMSVRPMCIGGLAFEEEIRQMNRNKSFEEGAKWADKTMIDKSCEWLKENLPNRMYDRNCCLDNFTEYLISDLRKYLEE